MATTAKVGANVLWKSDSRNFSLPFGNTGSPNQVNFGTAQVPGVIIQLTGSLAAIMLFPVPGLGINNVPADAGGTTPNSYAVIDLSA